MLEMLLSSQSIAEFLNRAENVVRISEYDRGMLKKYEELSQSIQEKESAAEAEAAQIDTLMSERSAKQQEVQSMAASTRDSIVSYANQLSSSQEEANALMSQINSADNSIANLMQQAEAQAAAEAEAQAAQQAEEAQTEESADEVQETGEEDYSQDIEDYGYNPEEDTTESYSVSTSSDVIVEEEDDESSEAWWNEEGNSEDYSAGASGEYEEEEESSSDSGQGTYLGNFTLTAYCNCAQCCGTAGNLTASGTVPTAGRTVAMAGVPFGTQLLINGNVYTVEDLGTPYGHVDIYCDSHETALGFGLQSADVYQLN